MRAAGRGPRAAKSDEPGAAGGERATARVWLWLLVGALPVFFIYLGANSIWDANEAFYVDTPRRMVEAGDYITPYFNGIERLNKPVLSYWIVATLYNLFGVSVAVERVGIALGAMGIISATWFVGRALASPVVATLAALLVATAPRMVMFSRRIFIDIWITCFMALTLACFAMAQRFPEHRRRWLMAMYVVMGLGVLTKGPIAVAFPVLVCAIWFTVERRWADVWRMSLAPGALIVLAIVVPWYAALYQVHGWGPIEQFFIGENVGRYTGEMPTEGRGVLFYLPVLFGDLFPWAPLLLLPILSAWRQAAPGEPATDASLRRLLWIWIVSIVGVFSLSQSKQDLYIFPVVPAVAALVAHALTAHIITARRAMTTLLTSVATLTIVFGATAWWMFGGGYYQLDGMPLVATVCTLGGAATLWFIASSLRTRAIAALAATFVAFNYVFVAIVLPSVERLKPSVPLAAEITRRAGPDGHVGAYHLMFPSLVYYAGRPIHEIGNEDEAQAFFAPERSAWVIMSDGNYRYLSSLIPGLCVVDRRPLFEARLRDLISGDPPEDVLLVTNDCEGI
jgi:4-amino-4-deoxy-L-arabinose transferase-like glycosyltransferase